MEQGRRPAPGERIYAIGDLHGRLDLFERLIGRIREDNEARAPAATKVVVLGDVVDRGPQSAALVARLMRYTQASDRFIVLKGNHEHAMVEALGGDSRAFQAWLAIGGYETLVSWGVPEEIIKNGPFPLLSKIAKRLIDREVVAWLDGLPLHHVSGEVMFVHAGLKPGVELARQKPRDLLWIGEEFLRSEAAHPHLVVHGHNMKADGPELLAHRIGVDTGAYATGRLTAVALEAGAIWTLEA